MKIPFLPIIPIVSLVAVVGFLQITFAQETQDQNISSNTASVTEHELTKFESSLVGKWYFCGDANKVCYFASSGSTLFYINESRSTLEMEVVGDNILLGTRPDYRVSCKATGDYLAWSNGFWCSRQPINWSDDPVIGTWYWTDKFQVKIKSDYSAEGNGLTGTWRPIPGPSFERHYEFNWDNGLYIDRLTLSKDGNLLRGENQNKHEVSANRDK